MKPNGLRSGSPMNAMRSWPSDTRYSVAMRPPVRSSTTRLGKRRVRRVDQHDRERRVGEPVALVGPQRERDDDQTVELTSWNFQQTAAGAVGGVDVVQHDLEPVQLQRPDDAAQALVRRRLVEERDEHADEPLTPAVSLLLGDRVGL